MKKLISVFLCILLIIAASSCGKKDAHAPLEKLNQDSAETKRNAQAGRVENIVPPSLNLEFSGKDGDASYDSASTAIIFSDDAATVDGEGAIADGTHVTVNSAGTYIFSGECFDGKITVTLGENEKAKLVFDGLHLTCKKGAAVVITEGDKVFLTLAEGSENVISDGDSYTETIGETNVDGAIFCRADMAINGSGALTVNGNNKHGIVSKDDLILAGNGILTVNSNGVGLDGKDCVKIRNMTVFVSSGGDGIRSNNTEDTDRGFVYLKSGSIDIISQGDGIQAETLLQIDSGKLSIVSGGGAASAPVHRENGMQGGFLPDGNTVTEESDTSTKGIKCANTVLIKGGEIQIDACDDGIHSDGDVGIAAGETDVSAGDDGIHAETVLEIAGGSLSITQSYEGLEGCKIYIKGGNLSVVSSDDGLNASDGSGFMKGGYGGMMGDSSEANLCISGGYLFVNAAGDGLDSNGNFDFTGGIVLVAGPTNGGNGALDYGDGCKATVSGGILIAVGALGMAENFTNAEHQGAILVNTGNCQAGTNIAVCDENGMVLASFTPPKPYQTAVITAGGIVQGKTYTVYIGADVKGADGNGFAENSTLHGGTKLESVKMTSLIVGSGGGMGGGMRPPDGGMRPGRK